MDFKTKLVEVFTKYEIVLNDNQINQFSDYYDMIIEWNEKVNLTAIVEMNEVIVKHFVDSVLPYKHIKIGAKLIDIGAGAGFPSIPLKILRPDIYVVMVDSLNKRIIFLQEVIKKLALSNIECVHARCEEIAQKPKYREHFDVAVARAVAKLNTLAEYCVPFVKVGGIFLPYKAIDYEEEVVSGKHSFEVFGIELSKVYNYNLYEYDATRNILEFLKTKSTPKNYPRGQNKPKTQPL